MKRTLMIVVALLVLLAAALAWQRHSAQRSAALRVPVPGGDGGGLPVAPPVDEHFDAAALERAAHDPAAAGLAALLVMRHGHLVLARYGHGLSADSVIDSGPFARALVALMAGVAVQGGALPVASLAGFDPDRLRVAIERATHEPYAQYLSANLWSRLNAAAAWIELPAPGAAVPAGCCFEARIQDWLRIGGLLVNDGNFEDSQVLRPGWVARMRLPISLDRANGFGVELPAGAQAGRYEADDLFLLRGPGRWRLWLVPSLQLVVLFGAPDPTAGRTARQTADGPATDSPAWDEARLPNLIIESLTDRSVASPPQSRLPQLVPGH